MATHAKVAVEPPHAMTFEQIAVALGTSVQNVHQIYHNAMRKLRQHSQMEQLAQLVAMRDELRYQRQSLRGE